MSDLTAPFGDDESPRRTYENAMMAAEGRVRTERDSLGSMLVPADAYWGVHTARALQNFPITPRAIHDYPDLVAGLAVVKLAAARANAKLGLLEPHKAEAIERACLEVVAGSLRREFCVGIVQGGAGTSTNMNVNEVIANRALEHLGHAKGEYQYLDPIDDVNRSQSTNDTYPTSIKIAMALGATRLLGEHEHLADAFRAKGREYSNVLKVGRTQLQDAVPMTVGQEFQGWAHTLDDDRVALRAIMPALTETNLGATAIGTGITADRRYAEAVRVELDAILPLPVTTAQDLIEATSDTGSFMSLSGVLKRMAVKLSKISSDLRLLSSGPQAGLGELVLPVKQAGSSIMPGKVNPVIPEVVNQVAFSVIGADATVAAAAEAGQLQLNAFEPIIAHSLLQSLDWLSNACYTLRVNCVEGIRVDAPRLRAMVDSSVGVVTALTPYIGYRAAADLAHEALETGSSIRQLVIDRGLLAPELADKVLAPERLSGLVPPTGPIELPSEYV